MKSEVGGNESEPHLHVSKEKERKEERKKERKKEDWGRGLVINQDFSHINIMTQRQQKRPMITPSRQWHNFIDSYYIIHPGARDPGS